MKQHLDILRPDPEIGEALRMIEADPPVDQVDWDALRTSIVARAEIPLARRRSGSARLGRWIRPLIPLAAAASIALLVWTTTDRLGPSTAPIAEREETAPMLSPEDIFREDITDQEFQNLVNGSANADLFLLAAVGDS